MHLRTRLAAVAAAAALIGGGIAAGAPSALACAAPQNCTNGTATIGSVLGVTGFPTQFAITTTSQGSSGNASGQATASPYSIFSNGNWSVTFMDDPADVVTTGSNNPVGADWTITNNGAVTSAFSITSTTTITHAGTTFSLPTGSASNTPPYVTSVVIGSGGPTAGSQNYADVFTLTVPATVPAGTYSAQFSYVLSAA